MEPMDAGDGLPTVECPECGANRNPRRVIAETTEKRLARNVMRTPTEVAQEIVERLQKRKKGAKADVKRLSPLPEEVSFECLEAEAQFIAETGEASEWESRAFAAGWLAALAHFGLLDSREERFNMHVVVCYEIDSHDNIESAVPAVLAMELTTAKREAQVYEDDHYGEQPAFYDEEYNKDLFSEGEAWYYGVCGVNVGVVRHYEIFELARRD